MNAILNSSRVARRKNFVHAGVGLAILLALPCAVSAYEIKSIRVGSTEADVLAVAPTAKCKDAPTRRGVIRMCLDDVSYAGEQADLFVTFMDGKADFIQVSFSSDAWPTVRTALTTKYPDGFDATTSTVQNRMGAIFDQQELTWAGGDIVMRAAKRSNNLESGTVEIFSLSGLTRRQKESQRQGQAAAEDI